MRLRIRIHEWLAERISWVQYPDVRRMRTSRPLLDEYRRLTRKQRAWFWFFMFWGTFVMLFVYLPPAG